MSAREPIVAIASAPGIGAIALVRISGDGSHTIAKQLLPSTCVIKPRYLHHVDLCDPKTHELIDDATIVFMRGPRSFTGEDSVEIFCHGGPFILQRLISALRSLGCRDANPGEFTMRAHLNGKIDLTTAEGINDLIHAQSHQQWLAARQLVSGMLRTDIEQLRRELLAAMAYLEASIDFPDEGDVNVSRDEVIARVQKVSSGVERLLGSYRNGKIAARGLRVALVGLPNAGKSTLLNTLLGQERAIVTPEPGTTRDYLEESCIVEGRLIRLFDTAGIRTTKSQVEQIGIEASLRLANEAELVLVLVPADSNEADLAEINKHVAHLASDKMIRLLTKSDLGTPDWGKEWLPLSCAKNQGIDALRQVLAKAVDRCTSALSEDAFVTSARQANALQEAGVCLDNFFAAAAKDIFDECLAFELQSAARALASIIGVVDNDEVLGEIFTSFCVGK